MNNFGQKMAAGVRWSAVEKVGQQGITFIVFMLLARLIEPADFGVVAMSLVVIALLQLFIDQGFSVLIVQRVEIDDRFLSTAFWTNLLVALILGLVLLALTDAVASFFHEPRVADLMPWMALTLLFEALMSVQQAMLKRNFDFKGLAIRTTLARLIAGGVGIYAAIAGWGAWSLVAFTVLSGALSTLILWWISDWRPKLDFSTQCFRELLNFGGNVTGIRLIAYVESRILDVLIGFFFGAVVLGYFTVAYQLVIRLCTVIVEVVSQVTISGFSRLQSDTELLLKHLLTITRLTTTLVLPLFALLGLMASDVVFLLFGDGWAPSARIVTLLAPMGVVLVISGILGITVMSAGAPGLILRARILATLAMLFALLAVQPLGFEALILTFTACLFILSTPLYFLAAKRVIPLRAGQYVSQLIPAIVATVAMAITVLVARQWLLSSEPRFITVILTPLGSALTYCLIIFVLDRRVLVDLRRVLFNVVA